SLALVPSVRLRQAFGCVRLHARVKATAACSSGCLAQFSVRRFSLQPPSRLYPARQKRSALYVSGRRAFRRPFRFLRRQKPRSHPPTGSFLVHRSKLLQARYQRFAARLAFVPRRGSPPVAASSAALHVPRATHASAPRLSARFRVS